MKKGFSVVLTSTESGKSKYVFLSRKKLYVLVGIAIVFITLIVLAVVSYSSVYLKAMESVVLRRRNADMEAEFLKLGEIQRNLEQAETDNQRLRVMLGLEESPPSVAPVVREQNLDYTHRVNMMAHKEENIPSLLPTQGKISRHFTPEHRGVDIAAPRFSPVVAAASGLIHETGWDSIFGNYVVVSHDINYSTLYGHLQSITVNQNDNVACGEVIGTVGSTGRSTSPHLHYEVWFQQKKVEPLGYMTLFVQR